MKDQLKERLNELKAEHEAGQKLLAELEGKKDSVKATLLRIGGAIQVLQEEIAKADQAEAGRSREDGDGLPDAPRMGPREVPA